ncbi:hypothetical protein glysoja_031223 [Glycine soja]|uniref:Mediator of RNA polymerase II transcription subunit 17 n=1 Tax=Glycine soja TaxID=3848 RepID=A0A0B2SQ11_GLYSO|nr:hypothetical protein glysoja_031223 [Glycine soja]
MQLQISLDKLPIKRLDSIEENGVERFPPDLDYDAKRLSLIRQIDFAWAVEKDEEKKKQKSSRETSTTWQWQDLVENLQLAHQELSVIIDLINIVEANDAVTVASMTRPKLLPNEALSDRAVSAAIKLQCYRHVGKYFKQSAKAFEQQVAREARFYGALIRLQQNWKVKRQRQAAIVPGNEGFTFDLFDNSYDQAAIIRSLSMSTVRVNHDAAGMLAINVSPDLCHSLQLGFVGVQTDDTRRKSNENKSQFSGEHNLGETGEESLSDEECVKKAHSLLREVHEAIFNEQVIHSFVKKTHSLLSIIWLALLSNSICYEIDIQQIFLEHIFGKGGEKPISVGNRLSGVQEKDGSSLLGHFLKSLAHRIFSTKVLAELENVVASQIINRLYQVAMVVGIKANRDFLCLSFELEQGETLGLVASVVDPENSEGCISWWLVMEDSFAEEQKLHMSITDGASEYRKFLGHLSLDLLYTTLIDLVGLCSGGGGQ